MIIKKIKIENFRSIQEQELLFDNINVFYGLNDVGKSNVLKALNLFFNGKTNYNEEFNFNNDFCMFHNTGSKKAKEIKIEITLVPPSTYKDHQEFTWVKIWRKDGLYSDSLPTKEGRVRKYSWARKIKYKYIPAVKDERYFSYLLKELYQVLSFSEKLTSSSSTFLESIKNSTIDMSEDIKGQLGFNSEVDLPSDLSYLFEVLDFKTSKGNKSLYLSNRGDGIKARHIPSILKFIQDNENKNISGEIRTDTIWGYEEPENSLEGRACFEKAKQLQSISRNVQMFITTHSPAFYLIKKQLNESRLYRVSQNKNITNYENIDSITDNIEDCDFLSVVSVFVKDKIDLINSLNKKLEKLEGDLIKSNKNILLVEGKTDKEIIEVAWKKLNPNSELPFKVECAGGAKELNNILARAQYSCENKYIIGIFDNDDEGFSQLKGLNSNFEYEENEDFVFKKRKHKNKNVFGMILPLSDKEDRKIFVTEDSRKFSIECYFSNEILNRYGLIKGYLHGSPVLILKDSKKTEFSSKIKELDSCEFSDFKCLFDKIAEILQEKKD